MNNKFIIIVAVTWLVIHWIVPRLYIILCAPNGIYGFLQSLILSTSPHCEALRYILTISSFNINYIWITLGGLVFTYFSKLMNVQKPKQH